MHAVGHASLRGSRAAMESVRGKTILFYSGVVMKRCAVVGDARPICRFTPDRMCTRAESLARCLIRSSRGLAPVITQYAHAHLGDEAFVDVIHVIISRQTARVTTRVCLSSNGPQQDTIFRVVHQVSHLNLRLRNFIRRGR